MIDIHKNCGKTVKKWGLKSPKVKKFLVNMTICTNFRHICYVIEN